MKVPKHWKAVVVLALAFVAGGVVGSVLTVVHFKQSFERALSTDWTEEVMQTMTKDLNLTAEQQPRIRAIVEDTTRQLKDSFGVAIGESATNLVSAYRLIQKELSPEQQIIHRRKHEEFRAGLKKALNIDLPPE